MKQPDLDDNELAAMLRALGHPARLDILRILVSQQHQCCCNDVIQCLPLAQSTVSQHLKVLLDAGLIERQPQGTRNRYSVRTGRLDQLEGGLSDLLRAPLSIDAATGCPNQPETS